MEINKRILVAPLDWGLGHATRCIPIIRFLQQSGCEVWIATSGKQETLLREECPGARFLNLPGYGVQYGKRGVMLRLLRQIPVIRRHIFTEHAWLQQVIKEHQIHGVISDNRYGLYSSEVPCVLITHQLALQMPRWARFFFRSAVQRMLYHHIEQFSACWVPDLPDPRASLAGDMSHPPELPKLPVHYIGWLSRFTRPQSPPERGAYMLISISGPEPQRTILENIMLKQIPGLPEKFLLIRGIPGNEAVPEATENLTIFNHVPAGKMQELMLGCAMLISRSGYSTLMDAMVLGTPLACIPTPGQTEQEYLSKRLAEKKQAVSEQQEHLNLGRLIGESKRRLPLHPIQTVNSGIEKVMQDWLKSLP